MPGLTDEICCSANSTQRMFLPLRPWLRMSANEGNTRPFEADMALTLRLHQASSSGNLA